MTGQSDDKKPIVDADAIRRAVGGERQLPKRFYETVGVVEDASGYEIALDGRAMRTPLKASLKLPTQALAEAVAVEWEAQKEHIDPAAMPITRLANTAIDRVASRTGEILSEITSFASSDFLCYRAEGPDRLMLRQAQQWDPILQYVEGEIGRRFILVQGVMHHPQPEETIARFTQRVAAYGPFVLTGLHNMMTLTGSAVLADAVVRGFIGAEAAWGAAHVDEDWQIEQWGQDEEAAERRVQRGVEFEISARFVQLVES